MNYVEFKVIIDIINVLRNGIYDNLVYVYGEEVVSDFFECYINDGSVIIDSDKLKSIRYYIGSNNWVYNSFDFSLYSNNLIKGYLNSIGNISVLNLEL